VTITFCFKLKKRATDTTFYSKHIVIQQSYSCVFEWYSQFHEGRKTFECDTTPGSPSLSCSSEKVHQAHQPSQENYHIGVQMLVQKCLPWNYDSGSSQEETCSEIRTFWETKCT